MFWMKTLQGPHTLVNIKFKDQHFPGPVFSKFKGHTQQHLPTATTEYVVNKQFNLIQ